MTHFSTFFTIISILLFWGCTPPATEKEYNEPETAFTNVRLLSMTSEEEEILENQTVRIVGDKIIAVGSANEVKPGKNATVIDGTGKYLMPGLAEMHAHIPVPPQGEDSSIIDETLFLYLSNGVTTIRGMLGNPIHLWLREQVASKEILGPRIYTSGPSFNGNTVPDPETAIQRVKDQKEAGYDFLKLHPGIERNVFDSLVAMAKAVGIPYAGHVPIPVGVRHAIASDYASIDHLDGYLEGLVPESAGVDPNSNGFFGFNFVDIADPSLIEELAKSTREKNVWIVPTQSLMVRWTAAVPATETLAEPEMKYMRPQTLMSWGTRKNAFLKAIENDAEQVAKFIDIRKQIIQGLKKAGVDFMLGSDAPQIFNVPGFSIQHEMQSMVDAGLTPYEVLYSGTANPAKYFDDEGEYGTIEENAAADLILLSANPLEDITNMRQQEGVMVRGKWLSKEDIQAKLKQIEEKYIALSKE